MGGQGRVFTGEVMARSNSEELKLKQRNRMEEGTQSLGSGEAYAQLRARKDNAVDNSGYEIKREVEAQLARCL